MAENIFSYLTNIVRIVNGKRPTWVRIHGMCTQLSSGFLTVEIHRSPAVYPTSPVWVASLAFRVNPPRRVQIFHSVLAGMTRMIRRSLALVVARTSMQ